MAISKITNESILDGEITDAKIAGVAAAKLTGTIANARISASSVSQHATTYDDARIRSDILKLALHQAIDGNRVAYNLDDSFIDGFEDDTGITTETTVGRDTTGEYVSSATVGSATLWPYTNFTDQVFTHSSGWVDDGTSGPQAQIANSTMHTTAKNNNISGPLMGYVNSPSGYGDTFSIDYKASYTWPKLQIGFKNYHGMIKTWRLEKSDDGSTWTVVDQTSSTASALPSSKTNFTSPNNNLSVGADGVITNVTNNGNGAQHGGTLTFGTAFIARHLRFSIGSYIANTNSNSALHFFEPYYNPVTLNATGTLISDPQTASTSRTSASGVIIYEDAVGTNTLGTDLKIYFSCDNSAWTEADSYGTATTYSGTKKLVKLGATTCTAGTSIAMKAVWANQSVGSQSQIAQGTGTAIGNAVSNGTLSSAFDGTTSQAGSASAAILGSSGNDTIYIGKDWGLGNTKTITGFEVWSPNNDGISSSGASGASGCSLTLFGSNSNDISTAINLGGLSSLAFNLVSNEYSKLSGLTTSTAYRYHWIKGISNGHSGSLYIAEVEFFETPSPAKEARLHGWAVNY